MRIRTKVIITILVIIGVILASLVGFAIWSIKGGTKITHKTPKGQRQIIIPRIPGLEKLAHQKEDCFEKVDYVYSADRGRDVTSSLKNPLKSLIARQGWELDNEVFEAGFWQITFSSHEKQGELERIDLKIGFEQDKGTLFTFIYSWPPCSEK